MDPKALLRNARESEDGEAYEAVARGRGFRVGVGARRAAVFVEIILDPFPERPRVTPQRLAAQAALVKRLQARGYAVACDADSTITCERPVAPGRLASEIRTVTGFLGARRRG